MRPIRTRLVAALAAPILALSLVACGDDDGGGGGASRDRLIAELTNEFTTGEDGFEGLEVDEARCVAETIVDSMGVNRVQRAWDSDVDDLDAETEAALSRAWIEAMQECTDLEMLEGFDFGD